MSIIHRVSRQFGSVWISCIAAAVLTACGGGGGGGSPAAPAPAVLVSGTAATGAAIASGAVSLKCASGSASTATTGVDGRFTVDVTGVGFPCLIRVTYKDAAGATQTLHSLATAPGNVNLTPLTELLVANALGLAPAAAFDAFDAAKLRAVTAAQLTAAAAAVKTYLASLGVDTTNLPADPIGGKFTAAVGSTAGDTADKVLDELIAKLRAGGKTLLSAVTAIAASPVGIAPTVVPTTPATTTTVPNTTTTLPGTTTTTPSTTPTTPPTGTPTSAPAVVSSSGSVTINGTNSATFTADSPKFQVSLASTSAAATNYQFSMTGGFQGATLNVTAIGNQVQRVSLGFLYQTAAGGFAAYGGFCITNCGATISTPAGATHPVTISFDNTTFSDGRIVNGSVTGDVSANTLWAGTELPHTTTPASVTIGGTDVGIAAATVSPDIDGTVGVYGAVVLLTDGRTISIRGKSTQGPLQVLLLASNPLELASSFFNCTGASANNCNGAFTETATSTSVTVDTTLMLGTQTLTIRFNTPLVVAKTTGSLTTGALADYTPNFNTTVLAINDTRVLSFTRSGISNQNPMGLFNMNVTSRGGKVTAIVAGQVGQPGYQCNNAFVAIGYPACTGATLAADGRTVTMVDTPLKSVGTAASLTLNGSLVANGL